MISMILPHPRGGEWEDREAAYCVSNTIISLGNVTKRMFRHRGEKQNLARARGKIAEAGADELEATEDEASLSILWTSVRSTGTWYSLMATSTSSPLPPPRTLAESTKPFKLRAQKCLASNGSRRRQVRISGEVSYFQMHRLEEVSQRAMSDCPLTEATIQELERTQQRSWIPSLALSEEGSNSSHWRTRLERKSQMAIRPWRSPTARRRLEVEGSSIMRRSRGRGCGAHRTDVTKGAREDEGAEEPDRTGAGTERTEMSCIDRGSATTTLLPAPYARRPAGLQSAQPPLSRFGGPGSTLSHE